MAFEDMLGNQLTSGPSINQAYWPDIFFWGGGGELKKLNFNSTFSTSSYQIKKHIISSKRILFVNSGYLKLFGNIYPHAWLLTPNGPKA